MKICIPTADNQGLESRAHGYAGGAPFYAVADTDSNRVEVIRNIHRRHGRGECGPGAHIRELGVNAVICCDIGRRAYSSLEEAGVEVLLSNEETVADILAAVRDGRLRALSADEVCHGGRHERGHGGHHGCRHGRGHGHHRASRADRPGAAERQARRGTNAEGR